MGKKFKKKGRMTAKQRIFLTELSKGKTKQQAAMIASPNVSPAVASSHATYMLNSIEKSFPDVMEESGITDELIADTLKAALKASQTYYSKAAQDYVTVDDWQNRIKAVEVAAKLKGKIPKTTTEVDHKHNFVITRGGSMAAEVLPTGLEGS